MSENRGHSAPAITTGVMCRLALAAAGIVMFSGCIIPETSLDTVVYFENKTDQTLWVRSRAAPDVQDDYLRIKPLTTTQLRLVAQGKCTSKVLITDADGKVVKDPGEVCWHATVTIPCP